MSDRRFWKLVLIINGAVPLVLLVWDAFRGQLGANGVNMALHTTGIMTLIFLFLALGVTPVRRLTGWNELIAYRRTLGLFAAFYVSIHLAIFYVFDRALSLSSTVHEILTRRYLQVGMVAVLLMVPLAATSNNAMVRRLGARRWKRLHRLAYIVAILGVLHFYMLVKADVRLPLAFAAVLAVLLSSRLVWHYLDLRKEARRPRAATAPTTKPTSWKGLLRVAGIFDETHDVRTFRLISQDGVPLPFDHRPGQFLNIELTIDGRRIRRSFTIASPPTRNGYCELTVKREDHGLVSTYLHDHLHAGDSLRVLAPAGRFVFAGDGADGVVLIAGGVGITPLMSIVRYLTDRGWPGEIHLLFVVKTEVDIIFREELDLLQKRFPNLHVNVTLTRIGRDDKWEGHRGHLTADWIRDCIPGFARLPVYLCGPDAMMAATKETLASLGVPNDAIRTEAFVSPRAGSSAISEAGVLGGEQDDLNFPAATARFARSGKTEYVPPGSTVLEASESCGVNLPFECRAGICGQCKVRLIEGAVSMDVQDALTDAEREGGWILACQSHPRNDIALDA